MTKRIWIDIDNSPHVPFFKPIIRSLREAGCEVIITARAFAQTHGLLRLHHIPFVPIGRHYGKRLSFKVFGLAIRSWRLLRFARQQQINLAVSHGSRSLVWTAYLLRIPSITLYDYEYVFTDFFNKCSTKVLVPERISNEVLCSIGLKEEKVAKYPGLKEEVYLGDFHPDSSLYRQLGIDRDVILVSLRPPATAAHYHDSRSEALFEAALRHILAHENAVAVVLPRTEEQKREILNSYGSQRSLIVPQHPLDGLNLLWHSDLVISGGGTMNREAALLGVPVFSIFSGRQGAVDRSLVQEGKLHFLRSAEDMHGIVLRKREVKRSPPSSNKKVLDVIVQEILTTA